MTIRIPGTLTNPDSMESSYVFCFFWWITWIFRCGWFWCGYQCEILPGKCEMAMEHPTMHEDGISYWKW